MITLSDDNKKKVDIIALHSEPLNKGELPSVEYRIVSQDNVPDNLENLLIVDEDYKFQLGKYIHSKNRTIYTAIGVVKSPLTDELFVWYRADYVSEKFGDEQNWVRPFKMFSEIILLSTGETKPRFEFVGA